MKSILIVDDDRELRNHLTKILNDAGFRTEQASSGSAALSKAAAEQFDVILLDMIMPKGSGPEALGELRKIAPRSKVIMITAFATVENAVDAMKLGACEFISKPFKIDELLTTVRRVLEETRIEECGRSTAMEDLLSALANPLRTKIIRLLSAKKFMRLMELARELHIEDHTKVIFHLKILKEAGIIAQDAEKSYVLTDDGQKAVSCLRIIDRHLAGQEPR